MQLEKPGHYQKKEKRSGLFFFFFFFFLKNPAQPKLNTLKKIFFKSNLDTIEQLHFRYLKKKRSLWLLSKEQTREDKSPVQYRDQ